MEARLSAADESALDLSTQGNALGKILVGLTGVNPSNLCCGSHKCTYIPANVVTTVKYLDIWLLNRIGGNEAALQLSN